MVRPTTNLGKKFSDFVPTKLSAEDFKRIEGAGGIKFSTVSRRAIQRHLSRFEYDMALREAGVGAGILRVIKKLNKRLADAIKFIEELDAIPGNLWQEIAARAKCANSEQERQRLVALNNGIRTILAKEKLPASFAFDQLLKGLAREFIAAGGGTTIASKRYGSREGRFAAFAAAIVKVLPKKGGINRTTFSDGAIASRWERIRYRERHRSDAGYRTWLGKPPAQSAFAQDWYWDGD